MRILYFDIAAFIILMIIMISLIFRKMLSGRANRFYAVLLTHMIITTIVDFWAESYGVWIPATESNMTLRLVLCYSYFFLRNLTTPLYQLFICAVTDTWHILKKSKGLQAVLIVPYAIICVTLLTNPFHQQAFYFDENLVYHRGLLIYVLYAASFFYLVCGVVYLIRYKKMVTNDKFVALMLMYPLNVLAILIQLFLPQYLVEMFMTSLTMLLVVLVIQRPEEIVNPVLGVRSSIAYTTDMKKAFSIQKPVRIIFAKLTNYRALLSLLEYDTCMLLMKKIGSDLSQSYREEHLPMDLYYLENGLFSLVTEKDLPEKIKAVAERVSASMTVEKQIGQLQIELESCVSIIRCPQDIVEENIQELSKEGIYFSLDDYGNGYSNLSRIMALPFHIIKLDKSLADKVDDGRMKVLLKNTIRMLHEIGMEIVVEGVETKETLQQFEELGCDFIQGYYFSKPLPEQEFVEFIRGSRGICSS